MVEQQLRRTVTLLDDSQEGSVWVVREDDPDRFSLTVKEAVNACCVFDRGVKHFRLQFDALLDKLTKWINVHRDRIKAAHVTIKEGGEVLFLVVQKEVAFDQQLTDDLSDLDVEIANDEGFDLIPLDVLAVPSVSKDSIAAFLSSGQILTHAE